MCHSVIFGSLTLRKMFSLDFGVKCNFSKIRIEHVMLKCLATTENIRKIRSEDSNYKRGKVVKNSSGKLQEAENNREGKESEIQVDQSEPSVER